METDRLQYFSTIAETGSLTKAALILGISHSGLSKAMSLLEAEVKPKLFRPVGRGLEITDEGRWFYLKAQEILRLADEISRRPALETPVLRVGLSGVLAITCAGALAGEIKTSAMFLEVDVGELEGKIVAGELDFGVAFVPSPKTELEYLELGEVRFNAYARADLLERARATALPYAVPTSEFPFNPLGYKNRDGWPKDTPRMPYFFVNSFAIALELLREGQAAVYLPDFVAAQENARTSASSKIIAVTKQKASETRRKVFLVKRASIEESREMKRVAKAIRRLCN